MGCIYKITNQVNGKFYIGRTKNFRKRVASHLLLLRKGKHHSCYLQSAWEKYGENNFLFTIVEDNIDESHLIEREQEYIDTYFDMKFCYNVSKMASAGGDLLSYHPRKEKIINDKRAYQKLRYSQMTAEDRLKILSRPGEINPNYRHGKYTRKPICLDCGKPTPRSLFDRCSSCAMKKLDRSGEHNSFYGKHHTEETKEKIRQHHLSANIKPANSIKISIYGVFYESYHDASRKLNINHGTVRHRCRSKNILYKDYIIVSNENNPIDYYTLKGRGGTKIICEGREFESYTEAALYYNLSIRAIMNRVRSKNYPEFFLK